MWIVQELWLARKILFVFGDSTLTFGALARRIGKREVLLPLGRTRRVPAVTLCSSDAWRGHPMGLGVLQDMFRRSLCHDPRDKVFSLLALLDKYERTVLETFFPDYTMSVERVALITLAHFELWPSSRYLQRGLAEDFVNVKPSWLGIQSEVLWASLLNEVSTIDDSGSPLLGRMYINLPPTDDLQNWLEIQRSGPLNDQLSAAAAAEIKVLRELSERTMR